MIADKNRNKLRLLAKQEGRIVYSTGMPCQYGHISDRYVANSRCIDCSREAQRQLKRVRDPEERARAQRNYISKNREKHQALIRNRRAREANVEGSHTQNDVYDMLLDQNFKCNYCEESIAASFHVDHIIPITRLGKNSRENLQLLCKSCNSSKNNKTHEEYIAISTPRNTANINELDLS